MSLTPCLTIRGRFAYWLHRRGDKHRPLKMGEQR